MYDLSSGTPTVPVASLNNPSPAVFDNFGFSVAISGTRVVVGAYGDDTGAREAGSAYVYDLSSGTPTVPVAMLNNPGPAVSDNFGWSVAIDSTTVAIGTPLDDSVLADKGYAYIFGDTTLAPTLIAPVTSFVTSSPISVSFSLPGAALPGSVKLSFGATQLRLANSQGTIGAHSFTFDPSNPTASLEVVSGAPLPDGVYSVTLSYQDLLGNPLASAVSTNVTVDTATRAPTLTAPATNAVVGSPVSVSFSLPEAALPGSVTLSFGSTVLVLEAAMETAGAHSFDFVTDDPANSTAVASGAPIADGVYAVTLSYRDALGNPLAQVVSTNVEVDAVPNDPVLTVLASKSGAVPGAGNGTSGIPSGAVWVSFGVPSVNDAGQAVVKAVYKVGTVSTTAILAFDVANTATMKVIAKNRDAAPGIPNAVMSTLKEPLMGPDGSVAWVATLANAPATTGAVLPANNTAIFLDEDGAGVIAADMVARKGGVATGAAIWKSFTSVALGANALAFTGVMESKTAGVSPGPGGATTLTDSGMWVYDRTTSTLALALREGDPLFDSTVKVIAALTARTGSAGQGRGVESGGILGITKVRVTLANNRQTIWDVAADGGLSPLYSEGGLAVGYGATDTWKSFGLPTQNSPSAATAFLGTVKPVPGGAATAANNVAIFAEDDSSYAASLVVKKGDVATGVQDGIFSAFLDPVSASNQSVAFKGTLKTVPGVTATDNEGLWMSDATNGLSLVAREGAQPAEAVAGAKWKAFTSLALPEGRGPLFVASMHSKIGTTSPGPGGITTATDMGLWATDSSGSLRLLLQEGDAIGPITVKTFTVLSSVTGSPAQTRSFNSGGSVIVRFIDTLNAQHLLHIAVP